MNNAKASNAIVAMADAMASMASDYEQQIAGLKQSNDVLAKTLKQAQEHSQATDSVVGRLDAILTETIRKPEGRMEYSLQSFAVDPEKACRFLQEELRRAPCLTTQHRAGSPGPQPTSPTSKGSSPSE